MLGSAPRPGIVACDEFAAARRRAQIRRNGRWPAGGPFLDCRSAQPTAAMASEHITTQLSDGILTVTLNRPDKLNAFTTQMGAEIGAALDRADRDDEVRVVVFTGAGRGFCAGADISDGGSV